LAGEPPLPLVAEDKNVAVPLEGISARAEISSFTSVSGLDLSGVSAVARAGAVGLEVPSIGGDSVNIEIPAGSLGLTGQPPEAGTAPKITSAFGTAIGEAHVSGEGAALSPVWATTAPEIAIQIGSARNELTAVRELVVMLRAHPEYAQFGGNNPPEAMTPFSDIDLTDVDGALSSLELLERTIVAREPNLNLLFMLYREVSRGLETVQKFLRRFADWVGGGVKTFWNHPLGKIVITTAVGDALHELEKHGPQALLYVQHAIHAALVALGFPL